VGRELGEVERDEELPDGNDGPGPEKCRAARSQAKVEKRKGPGGDRDVRERDSKVGEEAQRTPEFLSVAKLLQKCRILLVLLALGYLASAM
jgi:hypothetical protein